MHEYSLAKELVNTLLDHVDDDKLKLTEMVHLELGELRIISREALSSVYNIIVEGSILGGSRLEFETVKLEVSCKQCDFQGHVNYEDKENLHFSIPVLSCPQCGRSVEIIKGNELSIRKLTIDDNDEG